MRPSCPAANEVCVLGAHIDAGKGMWVTLLGCLRTACLVLTQGLTGKDFTQTDEFETDLTVRHAEGRRLISPWRPWGSLVSKLYS